MKLKIGDFVELNNFPLKSYNKDFQHDFTFNKTHPKGSVSNIIGDFFTLGEGDTTLFKIEDITQLNGKSFEMENIIGYKLIKESVDANEGTEFKFNTFLNQYEGKGKHGGLAYFNKQTVESQPEWFTPIYEEKFKVGEYFKDEEFGVCKIEEVENEVVYTSTGFSNSSIIFFDKNSNIGKRIVKITEEEYNELNKVEIAGYEMSIDGKYVNFGCQTFTKDEIEIYKELLDRSEVKAKITIRDVEITSLLLEKILKRLK